MRTVSFSANGVRQLLNEEFVCLSLNTRGDPTAGESFSHAPTDPAGPCLRGNGQQNVQVLFMTPAGEIFGVLTGFVGPKDFQTELEFALATYRKLARQESDRRAVVRDAHVEFLRQQGFSDAEIERPADDLRALLVNTVPRLPTGTDGDFSLDGVIGGAAKNHVLADHRYAIQHPLLPMASFRPEALVGSGKSFFGSTSFGNMPNGFRGRAQDDDR
jgi:hypothetical protein